MKLIDPSDKLIDLSDMSFFSPHHAANFNFRFNKLSLHKKLSKQKFKVDEFGIEEVTIYDGGNTYEPSVRKRINKINGTGNALNCNRISISKESLF